MLPSRPPHRLHIICAAAVALSSCCWLCDKRDACACTVDSNDYRTSWTSSRNILGDTSRTEGQLQLPLSLAWRRKLGDFISASAVTHGDCGFIGNEERQLIAFDIHTGVVKWMFMADAPIYDTALVNLEKDRIWFIDASGTCYCIDGQGAEVWRHVESETLPTSRLPSLHSALTISGPPGRIHYVLASATAGTPSRTIALHADTGQVMWSKPLSSGADKPLVRSALNERILVQSQGSAGQSAVIAYRSQDGEKQWEAGSSRGVESSGIVAWSRVVLSLEKGKLTWHDPTSGAQMVSANLSVPALARGYALWLPSDSDHDERLIAQTGSTIEAFPAYGGDRIWAKPAASDRTNTASPRPAVIGNTVIHMTQRREQGSTGNEPYDLVVRSIFDGAELQRLPERHTYGDPIIAQSMVIVASSDGWVSAYR